MWSVMDDAGQLIILSGFFATWNGWLNKFFSINSQHQETLEALSHLTGVFHQAHLSVFSLFHTILMCLYKM